MHGEAGRCGAGTSVLLMSVGLLLLASTSMPFAQARSLQQAHDAAYQRWTPAKNKGCDCLPTWSYTTTTGTTYNITNGTCQNPGREWSTDWCYVNPLSCAHRPFLANGAIVTQAWDTCMGPNLNKSIDSEKTLNFCNCMDSYEVSTPSGTIQATQGQCIQIDASRPPFCYVVNATCSVPAPTTAAPGVTDGAHNGSAWDYCRGAEYVPKYSTSENNATVTPPRPPNDSGCKCLPKWNYTVPKTNQVLTFNGTCANPGNQPMGPWCYVDAKTCKYPPLNDTTGQSYGWCTNEASTTTYDTAKTVNYCACLPRYNVTGLDGKVTPVTNGSCIRTSPGELPWCHVVESTCITPVTRRDNIAFDTCLNLGDLGQLLPGERLPVTAVVDPASASSGSSGLSGGAIAGIVIGCVAALALLAALIAFFAMRARRRGTAGPATSGYSPPEPSDMGKPATAQANPFGKNQHWSSDVESSSDASGMQKGGHRGATWGVPVGAAGLGAAAGAAAASNGTSTGSDRSAIKSMWPGSWGKGGDTGTSTDSSGLTGKSAASSAMTGKSGAESVMSHTSDGSLPKTVPDSSWQIEPEDIDICKKPDGSDWQLGSGGFGKVYKAVLDGTQPVAVKKLLRSDDHLDAKFLREISILKECRSTQVVQFLGACLTPGCTMLVTELLAGGSLQEKLAAGKFTWYKGGAHVALDVAWGLAYLHKNKIAHLDIKSGNVLLTEAGRAKIADVGLAHTVETTRIKDLEAVGTFAYAAPELLTGFKCNEKADIWSFGVLLWELASGARPRRGTLRVLRVPEECPAELPKIIEACMHLHAANRPTASALAAQLAALAGPDLAADDSSDKLRAKPDTPTA